MVKQRLQPIIAIRHTLRSVADVIGAYMRKVTVFFGQLSGVLILAALCFMFIVLMGLWQSLVLIAKPLYGDSELRR